MKVCLVTNEFFSWGVYGGFGAFTRKLGRELVKRGVEVEALCHHISNSQKPMGETEVIDGVSVKTLPRKKLLKLSNRRLYRSDADIIHSQCGLYDTYLAFKHNPGAEKIVTFQDLRTREESKFLSPYEKTSGYPFYKALWKRYVEYCHRKAVRNADLVAVQAQLLKWKVLHLYGKIGEPVLLPNFVDLPKKETLCKSDNPTVLWLGRLDPVKHPELCFELARETPGVDFHILGKAHDKHRDMRLRHKYAQVPNLLFHGFQSGRLKEELLCRSWILINTSYYECLPLSFLEAMSHKCAILSTQNPDNYTESFGAFSEYDFAESSVVSSLKKSLDNLLEKDNWNSKGQLGYEYVDVVHSTEKGVDAHIQAYESVLR